MDGCVYLNFPSYCFSSSLTYYFMFLPFPFLYSCHCQCNECLHFVFRSFDPHFPIFADLICLSGLFKAFS